MRLLIVAEKDSVARAISRYLSESSIKVYRYGKIRIYRFYWRNRECYCIGLRGHILDFDFEEKYNDWNRVDPEILFKIDPVLVVRPENLPYVKILKSLAERCNEVILALDSDSEGEAISFEVILVTYLTNPNLKYRRALFSAVTKRDIVQAFNNLTNLRPEIAKKVFTRMILDLTLGAVFTRLLTLSVRKYIAQKLGTRFLSYGPCQSPVLNLVVQRALEREKFIPEKYYTVHIYAAHGDDVVRFDCTKTFKDRREAERLKQDLEKAGIVRVSCVRIIRAKINPPKPLDTIELERRLSRFYNIRPKKALDIAEELYRHGYISYPRTETTIYPPTLNLREILQELLSTEHSDHVRELLRRSMLTPTRGNTYDGAHPPIYPTLGATREEILTKFKRREYWIVYDFVVRHFLATLSDPARVLRREVEVNYREYVFRVEGLEIVSEGYWKVYPYEKYSEKRIPELKRGQILRIVKVEIRENKTKPPPYLSESELLKLMRKYGIGTDATMQEHIHTNIIRGYFKVRNRQCIPTELGKALIRTLSRYSNEIIDPTFRGKMEKMLNNIIRGEDHVKILEEIKRLAREHYRKLISKIDEIGKELAQAFLKTFQQYRKTWK